MHSSKNSSAILSTLPSTLVLALEKLAGRSLVQASERKAEQTSDLASDLPGQCPDYVPAHECPDFSSKTSSNIEKTGSRF